jgi:sister chromatid cohesion protein DCC1
VRWFWCYCVRLTIKGKPTDEAVICTSTETFQLRTISLSNSLLVLQSPQSIASSSRLSASSSSSPPSTTTLQSSSTTEKEPPELHLQDTSHEILELIPIAPRLERIDKILKTSRWGGMGESTGSGPGSGLGGMEEVRAGGKRKSAPTEQGDQVSLPSV